MRTGNRQRKGRIGLMAAVRLLLPEYPGTAGCDVRCVRARQTVGALMKYKGFEILP